jgi:hypothetical protein
MAPAQPVRSQAARTSRPFAATGSACLAVALATGCTEAPESRPVAAASSSISKVLPDQPLASRAEPARPAPVATLSPSAARSEDLPAHGLTLVGTTLAQGESFAILRRQSGPPFLRVRVGDRIDRLQVTRIDFDRVALAASDDRASPTAQQVIVIGAPQARVAALWTAPAPASAAADPPPEYTEPETIVAGH